MISNSFYISFHVLNGIDLFLRNLTQVSRNPETGISKGCGYVTMGSINSAKVSIAALDGSVSVKLSIS